MQMARKEMMQRIERLELSRISRRDKELFKVRVPWGEGMLGTRTDFIGVQHDATILVMQIREWIELGDAPKKGKTEERMVMRVKDGTSIEYLGNHYIGSDGGWSLFEVRVSKEKDDQ